MKVLLVFLCFFLLLSGVGIPFKALKNIAYAAPTTSFTVSETGTLTLDALTEGYVFNDTTAVGVQKYVTLTKVGTGAITNMSASFGAGV
ncbi:MAG: hypothetical protein K0Q73_8437, partial [Paenibacillus sp.]|nr:hypothetical protein [Paenibacillus sp.]